MLVGGWGSLVAGVGVGLTVTEHAAQYNMHSWAYHAPAAVWHFFALFGFVRRHLAIGYDFFCIFGQRSRYG